MDHPNDFVLRVLYRRKRWYDKLHDQNGDNYSWGASEAIAALIETFEIYRQLEYGGDIHE